VIQERLAARNAGTIRISAENPFGALLEFPIGRDERGASSAYHRLIIFENSWVDHRGATANATREFIHRATRTRCAVPLNVLHCSRAQHGAGTRPTINLTVAPFAGNKVFGEDAMQTPGHLGDARRAFRCQPIQRASWRSRNCSVICAFALATASQKWTTALTLCTLCHAGQ